ncbi:hypothetical protein [Lacticaseibacillus jixiensis]|uniref:hypothetical protein n=1 Tax=Lacticaseibacillus jixiensis TaxID=3231926 RepID=UPI0036F314C8
MTQRRSLPWRRHGLYPPRCFAELDEAHSREGRTGIASVRGGRKPVQASAAGSNHAKGACFTPKFKARIALLSAVFKLAAISTESQAQPACLFVLIVSRPDRLAAATHLRNTCP